MLYREIIAVCSQSHIKHIDTLCGQNADFLNAKLAVHIVTTGLSRAKEWRICIQCCIIIPKLSWQSIALDQLLILLLNSVQELNIWLVGFWSQTFRRTDDRKSNGGLICVLTSLLLCVHWPSGGIDTIIITVPDRTAPWYKCSLWTLHSHTFGWGSLWQRQGSRQTHKDQKHFLKTGYMTGTVQRAFTAVGCNSLKCGCRMSGRWRVRYRLGGGEAALGHLHFAFRYECHSQRHFNTQRLIFVIEMKCVICEAGTRSPHVIHINFELPWLSRPATGLSLRRSLFHPQPANEWFLVAEMPLGMFPSEYFCCPLSVPSQQCWILISISIPLCQKNKWAKSRNLQIDLCFTYLAAMNCRLLALVHNQ